MPITFTCPKCGRALEAPDAAAGQHGVCKFCKTPIIAPLASGQPARADTPAPSPPTASATPWIPPDSSGASGEPVSYVPYAPPPDFAYASFGQRAFGFIADMAGQWLIAALLSPVLSAFNPWPAGDLTSLLDTLRAGGENAQQAIGQVNVMNLALGGLYWLVWGGIIQWLYFALFESSSLQATPGKLIAGTKVTDMDGNRISFGRATTRALSKGLSALLCYIGYAMAAFTEQRQALHDIIAQTLVLKR